MSTLTMDQLIRSKEERDAFVASQIDVGIPFQIRALRKQFGLNQKELAELTGMRQPRISAMERPGSGSLNLETLKKLASAFDVGLLVKFAAFSELVAFENEFSPDDFRVLSFSTDLEQAVIKENKILAAEKSPNASHLRTISTPYKHVANSATTNTPDPVTYQKAA